MAGHPHVFEPYTDGVLLGHGEQALMNMRLRSRQGKALVSASKGAVLYPEGFRGVQNTLEFPIGNRVRCFFDPGFFLSFL